MKQESLRDRQDWTPKGTVEAKPSEKPSHRLLVIIPEDQGPGQGWAWYKTPRQLDLLIRHLNPKGERPRACWGLALAQACGQGQLWCKTPRQLDRLVAMLGRLIHVTICGARCGSWAVSSSTSRVASSLWLMVIFDLAVGWDRDRVPVVQDWLQCRLQMVALHCGLRHQ